MSTRPQMKPESVITNGAMTGNIISRPSIVSNITIISYQASWAGAAPVGTLSVEVSNDYALSSNGITVANAGTWSVLPLIDNGGNIVLSLPVSGATGDAFINVGSSGAYAMRLLYTFTSGTGTLQATVVGKVA